MWQLRPPRDPPPFMANAILNFHFDYWHTSLRLKVCIKGLRLILEDQTMGLMLNLRVITRVLFINT